jgi:histidinol dehydrogenase
MSAVDLAIPAGTRVDQLMDAEKRLLFERGRAHDPSVMRTVTEIVEEVRTRGDEALRDQAKRFDGVDDLVIEVPRALWQQALQSLGNEVRAALELAASNIATFHRAQLPAGIEIEPRPGLKLGRRADALARVAIYAPGGRAAYPSSALMGVVPARIAGVEEIIVCSPAGPDGLPPSVVLAACEIGNADRVFAIGGAGAIAAAAYGTDTIPRVDKVVGPGNAYVTEAKRQLNGVVAIDCPAGPSEVLVLADDSANAEFVAYELLAQAEHDPDAACVLVTTSSELLDAVAQILSDRIGGESRADIISRALRRNGALLLAANTDEMLAFNRDYAPEHLALYITDARAVLSKVRNAGTVFLGNASSVAFGDYLTGANHVLPTATLARSYSGLSTLDFVRWTTYQELSPTVAREYAPITSTLADAEGLPAHARAARLRGDR